MQFLNQNIGWAYGMQANSSTENRMIYTTNGGDTKFIVSLIQVSAEIPSKILLYQNYPNPFNPVTNIKYSIMSNVKGQMSNVKLAVFDITGREIIKLVNVVQRSGTYEVDFNGSGYASGVYFYKLTVSTGIEVFTDTKTMIHLK